MGDTAWDGIKFEEQKMRSQKLERGGPKSRIHWVTEWCPKQESCVNFEKKCSECIRYSEYE